MMHLLRKYDVAHFIRNDAMFSKILGEADIIHEVNIISVRIIICRKANIIEKTLVQKELGETEGFLLIAPL